MFCSTIIPTISRPSLPRAVASVLDQDFDPTLFEVIVVNDSGRPLPETAWQRTGHVRVVDTQRHERNVARNTGAAIARGKYLHFLDDDDLLLPGALRAFWAVDRAGGAIDWMCGHWQTVDNAGALVDEFRPDLRGNIFALLVSGEGLPLQASLLHAARFFEIGGFDPTPALIGVEDRDLGRRMALCGSITMVRAVVARVRIGQESSTTDWSVVAERDRQGREKALSAPRAFARLRDSARSSYWRGRVSRAYFASAVWNLQRANMLTAFGRATKGVALANRFALTAPYWRGIATRIA